MQKLISLLLIDNFWPSIATYKNTVTLVQASSSQQHITLLGCLVTLVTDKLVKTTTLFLQWISGCLRLVQLVLIYQSKICITTTWLQPWYPLCGQNNKFVVCSACACLMKIVKALFKVERWCMSPLPREVQKALKKLLCKGSGNTIFELGP